MTIESVVRPFASPTSSPPLRVAARGRPGAPPVTAIFGQNGSIKTFRWSINWTGSVYTERVPSEPSGDQGINLSPVGGNPFPPVTFP